MTLRLLYVAEHVLSYDKSSRNVKPAAGRPARDRGQNRERENGVYSGRASGYIYIYTAQENREKESLIFFIPTSLRAFFSIFSTSSLFHTGSPLARRLLKYSKPVFILLFKAIFPHAPYILPPNCRGRLSPYNRT